MTIKTATHPRAPPHLPFMSGAPDFVVGLRPIPLSRWIDPETEPGALHEKRSLLSTRRADVYATNDSTSIADMEGAVEQLVHAARPHERPLQDQSALFRAASLTSDDLVIMTREPGGWIAAALVLCAPTYFSASDALGKNTIALHAPVPDTLGQHHTQALGARIARVFDGLRADLVLERFNWTVQTGPARFTPDGAPLRNAAAAVLDVEALDTVHLRVERQTVRRIPAHDAILFTIRVSLDPLRAVFAQPGARDAFAVAWSAAPPHLRTYKGWAHYDRLVAAALRDSVD